MSRVPTRGVLGMTLKKREHALTHNVGCGPRPKHLPRRLKKGIKRWLDEADYRFPKRTRVLFLRWIQAQRTANDMGPLRRLPDGRVSMFDLL